MAIGKDGLNPDPLGSHELASEQPKFETIPGYQLV